MKNKIAAVVLAASMFGTAVMPAANVFAAEAAETALQCHQHRMYQWNRHPDQAEDRRLIHLPRSQIA